MTTAEQIAIDIGTLIFLKCLEKIQQGVVFDVFKTITQNIAESEFRVLEKEIAGIHRPVGHDGEFSCAGRTAHAFQYWIIPVIWQEARTVYSFKIFMSTPKGI